VSAIDANRSVAPYDGARKIERRDEVNDIEAEQESARLIGDGNSGGHEQRQARSVRARNLKTHRIPALTVHPDRLPDELVRYTVEIMRGGRRSEIEATESIEIGLKVVHGPRTLQKILEKRPSHGGLAWVCVTRIQVDAG
jgi:hypothetical protein